ncbi:MAG: hypothetical protein WC683_03905 [bacterium]
MNTEETAAEEGGVVPVEPKGETALRPFWRSLFGIIAHHVRSRTSIKRSVQHLLTFVAVQMFVRAMRWIKKPYRPYAAPVVEMAIYVQAYAASQLLEMGTDDEVPILMTVAWSRDGRLSCAGLWGRASRETMIDISKAAVRYWEQVPWSDQVS